MRYYLRANGDKWEIVKQDDELSDIEIVGEYDTFDEGISEAETYSPLAYDESFAVPDDYRAPDAVLDEREGSDG